MAKPNKYALVLWIEYNTLSIVHEKFVPDKEMFNDDQRVGLVTHGDEKGKPPKQGWKICPARVLSVNENKNTLRLLEADFIEELNLKQTNSSSKQQQNNKRSTVTDVTESTRSKKLKADMARRCESKKLLELAGMHNIEPSSSTKNQTDSSSTAPPDEKNANYQTGMDASSEPNPQIITDNGNAVASEESTALPQQPTANLNSSADMFVEAAPSEGPIDIPVGSVDEGSTSEYADLQQKLEKRNKKVKKLKEKLNSLMETHNAEIQLKNEEIEAKNAPIEQLQRQRDEYIAGVPSSLDKILQALKASKTVKREPSSMNSTPKMSSSPMWPLSPSQQEPSTSGFQAMPTPATQLDPSASRVSGNRFSSSRSLLWPTDQTDGGSASSFLTETQMKEVSKIDDFGRLTCRLMTHLFSKEEMMNGVVCGINKASDKIKLNEEKIRFIEEFVSTHTTNGDLRQIHAKISQKCRDTRKSTKKLNQLNVDEQ